MNRRQFLSFASVPIAASVVVPELLRTIILPPRGGWPDFGRYLTQPGAWKPMGWKDVEGDLATAILRYVSRERYGNRMMTAAEFRYAISQDLNKFWRDAYDGKLLDPDGKPIRFAEEWSAIYGTSG